MTHMDRKMIIKGIISGLKQADMQVEDNVNLIESGILDSFEIIQLILELEKSFKVKIPGDKVSVENFSYIGSISSLLETLDRQ